ncbi:MAG: N-acetylmuramoyl-L-alanine amidase [Actinomycetota bacterium]|nr:N-acetylmuramoyl-L-alanine amidase [Actinomycetota bacterium]
MDLPRIRIACNPTTDPQWRSSIVILMRLHASSLIAALALAALIVGIPGASTEAAELPPGGTFVDDNGSSQEPFIEAVYADGITKGCNPPVNDRYCPDRNLTRAEMATMLTRALELPASSVDHFSDDDSSIHETAINALSAAGITKGCNPPVNNRFCPEGIVTRGQMAAFMVRAFDYTDPGGGDLFTDDNTSVFEGDIDRLATAGITKGCNPPANTHYCADDHLTRGQMAVFLTRALGLDPVDVPVPVIELNVASRQVWGAQEADPSLMQEHTIERMTIHHAGDQQTGATGPARYRSWQAYHMSRGWGDLAYHYIIGVDGTVYEGRGTRYAGATGTNYDPATHLLIVVEGNFEHDRPTSAQIDALVRTLAWASTEFDVSPSTISGHRDHANTDCPGANLYPYIASGDLESDVAALLASPSP